MRKTAIAALIGAALVSAAGPGLAAEYEFLAAPEVDLNRVYRLDKATGEVGACQYGLAAEAKQGAGAPQGSAGGVGQPSTAADQGTVGITLCYPPGDGGGPQAQSDYALIASRHEKEGGVFRVDLRSGTMSICYVLNDKVVCTPPAR